MNAHRLVSDFESRRPKGSPLSMALVLCGLLATALLGGFALAKSVRSGQSAHPVASPPATFANHPARSFERGPGEPSPFGYLVYDWEGPIPAFDRN